MSPVSGRRIFLSGFWSLPVINRNLLASGQRQLAFFGVPADSRSGTDGCARTDLHGSHQLAVRPDKCVIYDHGLMFAGTVIVTGNDAGTNVHITTDFSIAHVGQVVRLGPGTHSRCLEFDKISDPGIFGQPSSGTQPGKRPDTAIIADRRAFDHAVGADCHPVRQRSVPQVTVRTDRDPFTKRHMSGNHDINIDTALCREFQSTAHIKAGWVPK